MERIILSGTSASGNALEAIFDPDQGMSLVKFRHGDIIVIDEQQPAQVIGPHYRTRLPRQKEEDRYYQGVARYVAWPAIAKQSSLQATLVGKEEQNGLVPATLEGQNFIMRLEAQLNADGLQMDISVVGDTDSVVGFQFPFNAPKGSKVISDVKDTYFEGREERKIGGNWYYDPQHVLHFDLAQKADYTFHSFADPLKTTVLVQTPAYRLRLTSQCLNQENAWNLQCDPERERVNIEFLASKFPLRPSLTVNALRITLAVL